jgi:hypothetical protein
MIFTAFVQYYAQHDDGRWLTTGRLEVLPDLDRAGVERLVAERAGTGIQIRATSGDVEGATEVGGSTLFWDDDALLAAAASTSLN